MRVDVEETILEYLGYVFIVLSGFPLGFMFWRIITLLFLQPIPLGPIMWR